MGTLTAHGGEPDPGEALLMLHPKHPNPAFSIFSVLFLFLFEKVSMSVWEVQESIKKNDNMADIFPAIFFHMGFHTKALRICLVLVPT